MKTKYLKRYLPKFNIYAFLGSLMLASLLLSACHEIKAKPENQAQQVAKAFWQAVANNDIEQAKNYVTLGSTTYLRLLRASQITLKRAELGDPIIAENLVDFPTILYTGEQGNIRMPARTTLVYQDGRWLVDVNKTVASFVGNTVDNLVGQFNHFLSDTLQGLDKALAESMQELNQSLQQGLSEFQTFKESLPNLMPEAPVQPTKPPDQPQKIQI